MTGAKKWGGWGMRRNLKIWCFFNVRHCAVASGSLIAWHALQFSTAQSRQHKILYHFCRTLYKSRTSGLSMLSLLNDSIGIVKWKPVGRCGWMFKVYNTQLYQGYNYKLFRIAAALNLALLLIKYSAIISRSCSAHLFKCVCVCVCVYTSVYVCRPASVFKVVSMCLWLPCVQSLWQVVSKQQSKTQFPHDSALTFYFLCWRFVISFGTYSNLWTSKLKLLNLNPIAPICWVWPPLSQGAASISVNLE